jgi:hypothetical protein
VARESLPRHTGLKTLGSAEWSLRGNPQCNNTQVLVLELVLELGLRVCVAVVCSTKPLKLPSPPTPPALFLNTESVVRVCTSGALQISTRW